MGREMDIEAHRDLKLLEAVEQDSRVTQRTLATKRERAAEPHQLLDHTAWHR